jgi:hypothetical protein
LSCLAFLAAREFVGPSIALAKTKTQQIPPVRGVFFKSTIVRSQQLPNEQISRFGGCLLALTERLCEGENL